MTVPVFLTSSYAYSYRLGMTDVADAITDFGTLAATVAWTNPGGAGRFLSPVDAVNRFMDVTFTRIDAKTLELTTFKDCNAVNFTAAVGARRLQAPSAQTAWDFHYFVGQYHFCILSLPVVPNAGTALTEHLCGGILDLSPEAQNIHAYHTWMAGSRSAANVLNSATITTYMVMIESVTPTQANHCIRQYRVATGSFPIITSNGFLHARPMECGTHKNLDGVGVYKYAGRQYQALLVSSSYGGGFRFTVPLDATTLGTFMTVAYDGACQDIPAFRIA